MVSFLIIGFVVWSVITALGEMAAMCPMKKGFAGYATRFVDPCLGFATGWNYFFKYVSLKVFIMLKRRSRFEGDSASHELDSVWVDHSILETRS